MVCLLWNRSRFCSSQCQGHRFPGYSYNRRRDRSLQGLAGGGSTQKKRRTSRTIDVIFRFGELIVGKFIDTRRALTNYTCDELYEDGFRLIVDPAPEEEIVEVTMDEIAKLKGVPVERLRVKKEDK